MNQSRQSDTEALRSDIDQTRNKMDDTIDALGSRFQPRHMLDELLGFFRRHEGQAQGKLNEVRESISHSSEAAMHTVVDTIKKNPLPLLVIGAGVGWMIYSSRQSNARDYDYDRYSYDPNAHTDRPLEYPGGLSSSAGGWREDAESKYDQMKEGVASKLSHATDEARHKMEDLRHAAGDKLESARQRASQLGDRVKDRTSEAYSRTRDRVVETAEQHPLELGLVCLAAGLVAGLLIPTADAVNRSIGDKADRLRDRTREAGHEMLEKGKRVADAAVSAVKEEAEAQGLTPDHLREKVAAVADSGTEAGKQTAREQGLSSSSHSSSGTKPEGSSSSSPNEPNVARPAV